MPQIVVLDGYTLNPGDLSWDGLRALGPCTVYDRTPPADIVMRAGQSEIVLTNKTELPADVIEVLTSLRYIGVLATGYNVVDIEAARRRGVIVTNVPAYSTRSVAQMVFAHLLNLALHVDRHARTVSGGKWSSHPDFCYWETPLIELTGLTMGIVGFGRIGRATAEIALALGMNLIAYDVDVPTEVPPGCQLVELDDIFRKSDVVSLHCPLTSETKGLVDERRLAMMKESAFLINTSRGPLIDEQALAQALNAGRIAGAGLDVLTSEPPEKDNPLLSAKNCFITPHISWATHAARQRLLQVAIENVAAFVAGKPLNIVNEP
ncbi:MAG: D-2-hydroxyacid dehydrogenase [Phycisphaerales bacterium]|nr:MAG: D-2-hydroxyacid dehydrogenase [Phycisphaerales bacterium]